MKTQNIFKPAFVTLFLIIVLECLQLLSDANYYPYLGSLFETLASGALALVSLSILMAVIICALSWIFTRLRLKEDYLLASVEILSVTALALVFVSAIVFVINGNFPASVKLYWFTGKGALPIATLILVAAWRIWLTKIFKHLFYNIVDLLYKPALGLTVASVVLIAIFFITAERPAASSAPAPAPSKDAPASNGSAKDAERPNVFLITFDSMCSANMSLYGYSRKTTPFLDEFAKESYVFQRMHSNYHNTQPSIVSILTSKYPWKHGVFNWLQYMEKDIDENIAAPLRDDFYTAAIVPGMYQLPDFLGLGGQFDSARWATFTPPSTLLFNSLSAFGVSPYSFPILRHINFLYNPNYLLDTGSQSAYYDRPFAVAKEFVRENTERAFFMWLHLWPPHFPYIPPPPFRGAFLAADIEPPSLAGASAPEQKRIISMMKARYDECILFSDSALKGFIRTLKDEGLYNNSIIIVSSDHGNVFDKDNTLINSSLMEEPLFHIPLLIHLPGQKEGASVESLAEHVDLAPTILDLLNIPIPEWMDGESLVPYMREPKLKTKKTKYSMSFVYGEKNEEVRWLSAYRGDYKLIYHLDTNKGFLFKTTDEHIDENDLSKRERGIYNELMNELDIKINENFEVINKGRSDDN